MAGSDPMSLHPSPEGPSKTRKVKAIRLKSLGQVEKEVKAAIWRPFGSSGTLLDVNVSLNPHAEDKYIVKLMFETLGQVSPLETEEKDKVQQVWLEEYESTPATYPLYQNSERIMAVKVQKASVQGLALPAVMKLYYCRGCSDLNDVIREAFLQVRVASVYTCRLLNLYIGRGSRCLFEVRLMMERLDGDFERDIMHRAHGNHYSEAELIDILHCVTEALLYAKLRVILT